jgi:peptide deformylase
MVNPVILESEGEELEEEGCLSIPGVTGEVARAAKVKVQGLNRNGQLQEIVAEELLARAFQHEIDHLEGVLFVDKAKKTIRK